MADPLFRKSGMLLNGMMTYADQNSFGEIQSGWLANLFDARRYTPWDMAELSEFGRNTRGRKLLFYTLIWYRVFMLDTSPWKENWMPAYFVKASATFDLFWSGITRLKTYCVRLIRRSSIGA